MIATFPSTNESSLLWILLVQLAWKCVRWFKYLCRKDQPRAFQFRHEEYIANRMNFNSKPFSALFYAKGRNDLWEQIKLRLTKSWSCVPFEIYLYYKYAIVHHVLKHESFHLFTFWDMLRPTDSITESERCTLKECFIQYPQPNLIWIMCQSHVDAHAPIIRPFSSEGSSFSITVKRQRHPLQTDLVTTFLNNQWSTTYLPKSGHWDFTL